MIIQLSSGKGPAECEQAVMLFWNKYLLPLINKEKASFKITAESYGNFEGCLKSLIASVEGSDALNMELQNLTGSIQWICESPFRKNHKRKNWFFQFQILDQPDFISFSAKDLVWQTSKSSGPGGQNKNKVETAVKVTHILTGISVSAVEERSQYLNKKNALLRLKGKIDSINSNMNMESARDNWMNHNRIIRGNSKLVFKGKNFTRVQ